MIVDEPTPPEPTLEAVDVAPNLVADPVLEDSSVDPEPPASPEELQEMKEISEPLPPPEAYEGSVDSDIPDDEEPLPEYGEEPERTSQ